MGHHTVPQKLLSHFEVPGRPGFIWQFDKKHRRFSGDDCLPIKDVLQKRKFYEPQTEIQLNTLVEIPGNFAMDKLRSGQRLTDQERDWLLNYVATTMTRVGRKRAKGEELAHSAFEITISNMRAGLNAVAESGKHDAATVDAWFSELEKYEKRHRDNPAGLIRDLIDSPWPSPQMVHLVRNMHWRLGMTNGPVFFLTSDNPAFFFESQGIAKPGSEMTFPIAYNMALFGSWTPLSGSWKVQVPQSVVKEANRRLASGAQRYLLYREKARWIETIAIKPYLPNPILWE